MEYIIKNAGITLNISETNIQVMVNCISKSKRNETGGVLLGYYTPDLKHAVICEVTGPPRDSEAGPFWFRRGIKGLKQLLINAWKDKQYYLGEWHFHPMGTTKPSDQDLHQMAEIAGGRNYQCPEAVMIIIAGSSKEYSIQPYLTIKKTRQTIAMVKVV